MKTPKVLTVSFISLATLLSPITTLADTVDNNTLVPSEQKEENKASSLKQVSATSQTFDEWFPDDNLAKTVAAAFSQQSTDYISEEQLATLTSLDCRGKNITDMSGLEKLTGLTSLDCGWNSLGTLDLSGNPQLKKLDCSYSQLTSLNISQNLQLTTLDCSLNMLQTLDVTQNPQLSSLNFSGNLLTQLDVSQNSKLHFLDGYYNDLRTLDLSHNQALSSIFCYGNSLSELDVSNNPNLTQLNCASNNLTELNLANNVALDNLDCSNNQLTQLDVTNNTQLTYLACAHNKIEKLDLTNQHKLDTLNGDDNELTSLKVDKNGALTTVNCSKNHLTDFSSIPEGAAIDGSSQKITLETVIGVNGMITLQLDDSWKDVFGNRLIITPEGNGTYDKTTNTITWENVPNNSETENFSFTSENGQISGNVWVPFNVVMINLTADDEITYDVNADVTEAEFLEDINAETDEGNELDSDFETQVNFSTPGDYQVTVSANAGSAKVEKEVTVHVVSQAPTIKAETDVTFEQNQSVSEVEFLEKINAETATNATISSDFDSVVDFSTPGDYIVTLQAENQYGQKSETLQVIVHIEKNEEDVVPPDSDDSGTQANDRASDGVKDDVEESVSSSSVKENDAQKVVATEKQTDLDVQTNTSENVSQVKNILPKTGDKQMNVWIAAGVIIALVGFSLLRRRKHSEN
ncbi:LapB repeat-containing protein [Listeria costaricensis]|uniref:LapB repeat-containing protein n=1 Tax=Listeria costaricensis TaxID=2026604 RepID=UPI000C07C302|nr:LapB repeat-containing protein [Listeria costaricensis]